MPEIIDAAVIGGTVAPGFEAVQAAFEDLFLDDPGYSAQFAAYWRGERVVHLVGGDHLAIDDLTGVFSASKGAGAITLATLIRTGELDLDAPVVRYWPEFGANGKQAVLVRELLSHQAGLVGADGGLSMDELRSSELAAARLAAASPQWRPGSAFGYHGLTIGVLMEEMFRRIRGERLQDFYEREIRAPRAIDFYLGLPEQLDERYASVLPMVPTPAQQAEIAARPFATDVSLTALMFNAIGGSNDPVGGPISPNNRSVRAAGPSAFGGVASADGLARLYAAAIGSVGGPALLDDATIEAVAQQQSWGHDRTLNGPNCFGIVFMKPQPRQEYGSWRAFGHDGAGGAQAFADPMFDMSFGYVPRPMQYPGGADHRALGLAQRVREAIVAMSH